MSCNRPIVKTLLFMPGCLWKDLWQWLIHYNNTTLEPITVAARSKVRTVFARLNTGIVGSNPPWGMDIYVCLFCVCVILRVLSGLATGWSSVRGVLPVVWKIKKLKTRAKYNRGFYSHGWMNKYHVRHCSLPCDIRVRDYSSARCVSSTRYVFLLTSEAHRAYVFETFMLKRIL
jgi:hypothetical protein